MIMCLVRKSFEKRGREMAKTAGEKNQFKETFFSKLLCGHPLLSPEETLELVSQAQSDLADEIKTIEEIDEEDGAEQNEEEKTYGVSAAMNKLIAHNQRLIFSVMGKTCAHLSEEKKPGIDFWDMVQIGNFGLRRAILKFDPGKECKLSTYAVIWIRQAITRAIMKENFRVMRVSNSAQTLSTLCNKFSIKARSAGIATDRPLKFFDGMTLHEMENAAHVKDRSVSLNDKITSNDGMCETYYLTWQEIIPDARGILLDDSINKFEIGNILKKIFPAANLRDREKKIVLSRFGVGCDAKTLNEIGKSLGLSRERIRMIEAAALEKLRRAYEKMFGLNLKRRKKAKKAKAGKTRKEGLSQTVISKRLRLINNVQGDMFFAILEMTPEEAERAIADRDNRRKLANNEG